MFLGVNYYALVPNLLIFWCQFEVTNNFVVHVFHDILKHLVDPFVQFCGGLEVLHAVLVSENLGLRAYDLSLLYTTVDFIADEGLDNILLSMLRE